MSNLTQQQSDRALALGQHDGAGLVEDIKARVMTFDTEEEKLLWWAAFMGYMGGICAAELGSGALEAIQQMTAQMTARVIQEHTN